VGDLRLDERGEHDVPEAAEERRGDVEPEGDDEHEQAAAAHAGKAQRQEHPDEGAEGPGAQVLRRLQEVAVDAPHHAVEGQDHERQQDVHHADVNPDRFVHELQRPIDDPAPRSRPLSTLCHRAPGAAGVRVWQITSR
jgi:hypothetical protein